jgi:hypothetical protein
MCNNEMNFPLFILVKSPYFTGRVDLSFFSFNFILFLLLLLQVFLQCFNGANLIFLSFIFFLCFLDSSSMVSLYFLMENDCPKLQNFNTPSQ